jgi:hypothetical protein
MAAQGRGPDRTLVHMSPKEVQGLQALAMAHGGSLTINPETGLPEAGFLESILPAVAGFALNAFAPGVGTAVGGMFGLGEAAGTALTVGGISGLASGSLEKGIMAGMGAYGGASLGGSLGAEGSAVNARAANEAAQAANLSDAERVASIQAAAKPDIGAGFSSVAKAPMDFLKDNKMALAAIAAPALMGGFDSSNSTNIPERKKYNMNYVKDPVTGALYDTSGEGVTYGGVGRSTRGMATGGEVMNPMTEAQRLSSIATENNAPNAQVAYDTRTDSQKALAYLMGEANATNPMLFTHKQATGPIEPADMLTRKGGRYILDSATNAYVWVPDAAPATGIASIAERIGGGGSGKYESQNPEWDAMSDLEKSAWFQQPENAGMKKFQEIAEKVWGYTTPGMIQNYFDPSIMERQRGITSGDLVVNDAGNRYAAANPVIGSPGGSPQTTTQNVVTGATSGYDGSTVTPSGMISGGLNQGPGYASYDGGSRGGYSESSSSDGGGNYGGESGGYGGSYGSGSVGGFAHGGITALAGGGLGSLGGYSDGGQLLKGPGDGVSDSIPAKIAGNQPARLANNEFVIPARIVSELGNGSTDAGARELYKMMARIQAGRKKSIGKGKIAVDSKAVKHLPA